MSRRIDVLVFEDFQLLDAAGPIAAFEIAARLVKDAYRVRVIAVGTGTVTSSSGVGLQAAGLGRTRPPHTLLITGGDGVDHAATCDMTRKHLTRTARAPCRIASVCSGAVLLAAAGLLDGRRATTHWGRSRSFTKRYPAVKLEPDRIYVKDGSLWTSAGITAGIDLALALITEDLGEAVARATARQLVVPYRRAGGQSQFSPFLDVQRPNGRFGPLQDWAREHLAEPLTVERLARYAAMSPRHFARAFVAETGMTPAKAIERIRLEAARVRVEADAESIERIAEATGFGDPERMRRAFIRVFGQPPQALRRAVKSAH